MSKAENSLGKVIVSERFRTPSPFERSLGLWVDRVGAGIDKRKADAPAYRRLGLFGAVCVTRGEGVFHSDISGELQVKTGDVMLLFPDVPSVYHPFEEWETEWVVWGGPEGNAFVSAELTHPSNPVLSSRSAFVESARSKLLRVIGGESAFDALARKAVLLEMLFELTKPLAFERGDRHVSRIENAVSFIESNIGNDISVSDVAAECGLSETHFRRLFGRWMGMSPKRFITSRRISAAKERLAAGTSVKETAAATGFSNEFYFRTAFKKGTGVTPGEFAASSIFRSTAEAEVL